jgi:hypothetical protein
MDYSPIYTWKVTKYSQYQKFKERLESEKNSKKSEEPKKIIPLRKKYDSNPVSIQMWHYNFLHFVLEVLISFLVLIKFPTFNSGERISFTCYVLFHMYSLSTIFDQKSYSTLVEIFRLIIGVGVVYYLNLPMNFVLGNFLLNLISVVWILIFNKKQILQETKNK